MSISACLRRVQTSDVFPESVSLKKGDYTVRVMLRHDNPELLDKLNALPVVSARSGGGSTIQQGVAIAFFSSGIQSS